MTGRETKDESRLADVDGITLEEQISLEDLEVADDEAANVTGGAGALFGNCASGTHFPDVKLYPQK
jgi:hypothetical protein